MHSCYGRLSRPRREPACRGHRDPRAIVAEPHAGYRIAPLVLHPTDLELVHLSPVPVLLVKNTAAYRQPVILAAVDPERSFDKPSGLDTQVLAAAGCFTHALEGVLHAVHAYVPPPVGLLELDPAAARQFEQESTSIARARFDRVLESADVPLTTRHFELSSPDEAIQSVAAQTGTAIVVIGAVLRSGLERLYIGNTAERTLDRLPCDVLVVKPDGFTNRVARETRGARYGVIGQMLPV